MKKLTQKIIDAVERGERVVLCTILASSGSSPRGAGARMAVFADGSTMGTVGGGRVELLAAEEAREILKTGETRRVYQYPTYYAGCCLWGRIDLSLGKERLFEVLKSRDGFLSAWELCR